MANSKFTGCDDTLKRTPKWWWDDHMPYTKFFSMAPLHEWSMFESQHVGWAIWHLSPAMGYPKTSWLRKWVYQSIWSITYRQRIEGTLHCYKMLHVQHFAQTQRLYGSHASIPQIKWWCLRVITTCSGSVWVLKCQAIPCHTIPYHAIPVEFPSSNLVTIHPIHYQYVYKFMWKL